MPAFIVPGFVVLASAVRAPVVRASAVRTPVVGRLRMPGGNIFHGPLSWPFVEDDAPLDCPAERWGVATAFPQLMLCGSGARRGGAVSAVGGHNAAMAVLEMLALRHGAVEHPLSADDGGTDDGGTHGEGTDDEPGHDESGHDAPARGTEITSRGDTEQEHSE